MASPVARAHTRPKTVGGLEWQVFYTLLLGNVAIAFTAIWNPLRLLMIPILYLGPYLFFRWAGQHDTQWSQVYFKALINRQVWLAGGNPNQSDPKASRAILFRRPKVNA